MSIYGAADTQILGGGFGGFGGGYGYGYGGYGGGYGCGIPAFGLFGLCGNGFGNNCNDKCNRHDGHDCHHSESVILDDAHYNSLQSAIGGVKDNINTLGLNIGDKFGAVQAAIANVNYNQAINTKDIIHDIDIQTCGINHNIDNKFCMLSKQLSDCCCEIQKEGLKNTQVILNELKENEIQALRDRLSRCEKDNDLFRFSANFRAQTVGSNFNTGVQSQSTSNNSGQIVA